MVFRQKVIGNAHKKVVLFQKSAPFFIQMQPVGLERVLHTDVFGPLTGQVYDRPEEVRPRQGGFAPLKGQGDGVARLGAFPDALQTVPEGLRAHFAEGSRFPLTGLVPVKAIPAPQVAPGGSGLQHDAELTHFHTSLSHPAPYPR